MKKKYALLGCILILCLALTALSGCSWFFDESGDMERAEENAEKRACWSNMSELEQECNTYYAEYEVFPRSIEDVALRYLGEMPVCPSGGTYTLDISKGYPEIRCSVHGSLP